jgi:hypothetical protein
MLPGVNKFGSRGVHVITNTKIKLKKFRILKKHHGDFETERFGVLIHQEPFDYTKWHQELNEDLSIEELSQRAMSLRAKD